MEVTLKTISPHFTEEILHHVIEEYYRKHHNGKTVPEISKYGVICTSGKGDGYSGVVYRITVNLINEATIHFIGKGMPSNIARRKTFHCERFFANEIFFYNEIVPAFRDFEKQQCKTDSLLNIPECYYAMSDGLDDFLVLEDLKVVGYESLDRATNLNDTQLIELFQLFARFHGISLAFQHLHPDKFKCLTEKTVENLFNRERVMWTERYIAMLAKYFTLAVEDELKNTKYVEKLKEFTTPENFYKSIYFTVETKEKKSVINHGDTWITNFMFKDAVIKMIDFQLIRYGSPVLDLSTVIFACTNAEAREKLGGASGILALYQGELNRTVSLLRAPVEAGLTLEELSTMWRKFGAHGFGFTLELVQLSLIDAEEVGDLDRFEGEEAVTLADITPFTEIKSQEGKKRLADILKLAVDEGII